MRTILIVEDEFASALALEAALEDEGYRAFIAANGRQALERMAENRPDLVITDLMMPLMNGAEMCVAMRADPDLQTIPILMMSGLPESEVRKQFGGYEGFLRKPFLERVMIERVLSVLKRY